MKLVVRAAVSIGLIAALLWWIGDDEASGIEKISRVLSGADGGWSSSCSSCPRSIGC